jgi:Prokaryotic dksA/traR C4-type zinc finger
MCIEDNTYGYCEETGEPISLMRLEARPIATLSVEAQERQESAKNSTATSSTPSVPGQAVQLAKAADKAAGLQAIVILGRANGVVFAENSGLADAASKGRGA